MTGVTVVESTLCAAEGGAISATGPETSTQCMMGTDNRTVRHTTPATLKLVKGSGSCLITVPSQPILLFGQISRKNLQPNSSPRLSGQNTRAAFLPLADCRATVSARAEDAADQKKGKRIKLKKLGMALVIIFALGVMMASSASAFATTEDKQWYIGASPGTLLSETESIFSTGSGELISEVGTTKLKLGWTGVQCVSCSIYNEGSAEGHAELEFTGVTVMEPRTCAVEGGRIRTEWLRIRADYMIWTSNYVRFEPVFPTTFAKFRLIKGSGTCPISGTYSVTGSDFVKTNNATGVFAASQGVTASGAINSEAGGELKLGAKKAELNGTASFSLTSGKEFATK